MHVQMAVIVAWMSSLGLFAGKMCMLLLYYRIFSHVARTRREIYAAAVFTLPLLAGSFAFPILNAPEPGNPWRRDVRSMVEPYILARTTLAFGVLTLLMDVVIAYIPIPPLLKMKLSRKKKAAVIAIFLTGSM